MVALTTRQRDLLQILLQAETSLGSAEIAERLELTPRQVNYSLKGLGGWLAQRAVDLKVTPGVGVQIACSADQARLLLNELGSEAKVQLILSSEQRQQLLVLLLLTADQPLILYQLQQLTQVSRTTVLKDLENLEGWFATHSLKLQRRPNYGIWIEGSELALRQGLIAWVYGEPPLGPPLTSMNHMMGLVFHLSSDAGLLEIVKRADAIIGEWDTKRMLSQVAYAEAQLDGRFSDDAVLALALNFAIQAARIHSGRNVSIDLATIARLATFSVWPIAEKITERLGWQQGTRWPKEESAALAMALLAAPRDERWQGDLEVDERFGQLVDTLMQQIAEAYGSPDLFADRLLRDGLVLHLVPTCLRHHFQLWFPSPPAATSLEERYDFEHDLANRLSETVSEHAGVTLSHSELNDLKLLLRAAYIRTRPKPVPEVWVICPSGMATSQLLIVRLQARFPNLGKFKIVSLRELNPQKTIDAPLILTTVPLPAAIAERATVIQVHPMLLAEDIEAITRWLA